MEVLVQNLDDIIASLKPLTVEWMDETAKHVIELLRSFPIKTSYTVEDVRALLDSDFEDGMLICRLFLGLSKDQFVSVLRGSLAGMGIGVTAYRSNQPLFLEALSSRLIYAN